MTSEAILSEQDTFFNLLAMPTVWLNKTHQNEPDSSVKFLRKTPVLLAYGWRAQIPEMLLESHFSMPIENIYGISFFILSKGCLFFIYLSKAQARTATVQLAFVIQFQCPKSHYLIVFFILLQLAVVAGTACII